MAENGRTREDYEKEAEEIFDRAEAGDVDAQYEVASVLFNAGDNYEGAFEFFRMAADQGHASATKMLADCYYCGFGTDKDLKKAFGLYRKAAKMLSSTDDKDELADTYHMLGLCYGYGEAVEQNYTRAIEFFIKASDLGHLDATVSVAEVYYLRENGLSDYQNALKWYEKYLQIIRKNADKYEEQIEKYTCRIKEIKKQIKELNDELLKESKTAGNTFDILFPTTYGETRFTSMEDVISQKDSNPDALGFFSQCSIFGAGTSKKGNSSLEGLFSAANAKCSDAILFLGRMYEYGMTFIRQDVKQALNLYKYAYSLENIDALHSLGYILYNSFDKKSVGLSMMKKSAELGSRGAKFHLNLLASQIGDIEICRFEEIPESEFAFSEHEALRSISLYDVDLTNPTAIKSALLNIMNNMKPQTFSVIMNEFRMKHLRGRELFHFEDVDFRGIFDSLVSDGVIEAGGVGDFGVTESTLYISRESTQKMKTTILDGDDWD